MTDSQTLGTLPDAVRQLLHDAIESYEQLELLLALERSRGKGMSAEDLAEVVRVRASLIEAALDALASRRLIAVRNSDTRRFFYEPASDTHDVAVRSLAQYYAEQPLLVIRLMSEHAIQRARASVALAFADAFLLRKDRSDG
ncbi:MAG TPA: hypothetical protein VMF03_02820 [Steroidobacteraceae bacterium]|nr:hypothetical protein [Steroidobacteraceae bacterium]